MRSLSLRSIVTLALGGLALIAIAPVLSNAAELPTNARLELPQVERPLGGWPMMVVVDSATEADVDVSAVSRMSVQRGVAAITITIPEGAGDEVCSPAVIAVLEFIDQDTRLDAARVVISGYGHCAREVLVLGNRYPDRIGGILAISPSGNAALPTMWGGLRSPQLLYVLASRDDSRATLDLADDAAGQWRAAGERVVFRKHDRNSARAEAIQTELNLALDWLLMVGGC